MRARRSHEERLYALLEGLKALNAERDLDPVLQRLLRLARELFACDRCGVYLVTDEGTLTVPAAFGLSRDYLEAVRSHLPWPPAVKEKPEPVFVEDARRAPELAPLRAAIEREGVRSVLFVPLFHERLVGKLALYHDRGHRWTREEVQLAQALADQAALAVARAREREQLKRQNEALQRLQALSAAWLGAGAERPQAELIRRALDVALQAVDADAAVLYEYDARRHELVFRETVGLEGVELARLKDEGGRGLAWIVFKEGAPRFINDYPRWPKRVEYWAKRGLQAVLGVPMRHGDRRSGVLVVGRFRPRPLGFSTADASLLQLLANQLSAVLAWRALRDVHRRAAAIGASLLGATTLAEVLRLIVTALVEQSPFRVAGALVFRRPQPLDDPEPPDVEGVYIEGLSAEQERQLLETVGARRLLPNRSIAERGRRIGRAYYVTPRDLPELQEVGVPVPGEDRARRDQDAGEERWGEHDTLVYFLEVEGRVLGRLTLADPVHGRVPTPQELEPLETLVQLAAWAVQKARYQERLGALYRVSHRLAEFTSPEGLQQGVLPLVREVFDFEYGALLLARDDGLEVVAQAGEVVCPYRVGDVIPYAKGVVGWVARERKAVLVPDVSKDPRYIRGEEPMGSELAVPIRLGDRLFGVLNLEDRRTNAYTPDDVSLLQALADQIALALGGLERQEALRRSRERLRGIYRLSELLTRIQGVDELLEESVRVTCEHFNYEHVVIFLREGDELVVRGYVTTLPREEVRFEAFERLPLSRGICGRVARTGKPALVPDVSKDPDYLMGHPAIRSELAVPIVEGGEVLGVINIESTRPNAFTRDDQELLEILARQVGVALRELEHRERLRGMNEFLHELNETTDFKPLLQRILERAIRLLRPKANAGSVLIYDEERGVYRFWIAIGRPLEKLERVEYREDEVLSVLKRDRPVILTRSRQLEHPATRRLREELKMPPPGSTIALPIVDPETGCVIAFFNVNNLEEEGVFTEKDAQKLWALRGEITAAVLRARDRERLKRMALHDALTGAYSRHYLSEFLQREQERAKRSGRPISLVMADLDRFFEVNDRFGHAVGDRVLQGVSQLLMAHVRSGDVVVRYGGDEFLIVLPETTREEAERVVERLRRALEGWDPGLPDPDYRLSVSFGVASWDPQGPETLERVLERADAFMYHRRKGRAEERRRRKRAVIFSRPPS